MNNDYRVELRRFVYTPLTTLGRLTIFYQQRAVSSCFTLEDKVRWDGIKVKGKTAIWGLPTGKEYPLRLNKEFGYAKTYDDRWGWHNGIVHIDKVDEFKYILVHCGNIHENTKGCLLVGTTWRALSNKDLGMEHLEYGIYNSQIAYQEIYPALQAAAMEKGALIIVYNC